MKTIAKNISTDVHSLEAVAEKVAKLKKALNAAEKWVGTAGRKLGLATPPAIRMEVMKKHMHKIDTLARELETAQEEWDKQLSLHCAQSKSTTEELKNMSAIYNEEFKKTYRENIITLLKEVRASDPTNFTVTDSLDDALYDLDTHGIVNESFTSITTAHTEPLKSKRQQILERSLERKEGVLEEKFKAHFDFVASTNGQPLNDKRNGPATFSKMGKQADAIRTQQKEVEKTQVALERETCKQAASQAALNKMPSIVQQTVASGELKQWRKFPDHFFVEGVDKGRIVIKDGVAYHKYVSEIPKDQYPKFRDVFNALNKQLKGNALACSG